MSAREAAEKRRAARMAADTARAIGKPTAWAPREVKS